MPRINRPKGCKATKQSNAAKSMDRTVLVVLCVFDSKLPAPRIGEISRFDCGVLSFGVRCAGELVHVEEQSNAAHQWTKSYRQPSTGGSMCLWFES